MFRFNDIRPAERRPAIAAFLTLLGITAGHTLLETARDALFLARLPVERLPWMYLAIAAVGLLFSRVGARKGGTLGRHAVVLALVLAAVVTVGFWLVSATPHVAFIYALYVWTGVFASWVVVRVWTALGQAFDVTQAKRLYGPIGAGGVLGAVVGAACARALAGSLAARHLLLGAAALLLVTVAPALLFARGMKDDGGAVSGPAMVEEVDSLRRQPYVARILKLVLVSTVSVTLVDYLFKGAVADHVAKAQLGSFFATYYVVLSVLALVTQLFGVSPLLRVLGVHRALWLFPTLLLFGTSGVIVLGGLLAPVLLKAVDGTMRHSLHRTTMELLFVPLPDAVRRRAKPLIDLVGQRGGQVLASLGILAVVQLAIGPMAIAGAVLVLVAIWLATATALRQHYLDLFRTTLRQGALTFTGTLPPLDLDALETLFAALNSQRDGEVVAALDLLAEQRRSNLIPALILYHPSPQVVLRALDLLVAADRRDFLPIADRLLGHADMDVRTAALRAHTVVQPDEELLRKFADAPCDGLRATAIVGLARNGWLPTGEARPTLLALAESAPPAARIALARALRDEGHPDLEDVLLALARSTEREALLPVISALAQLKSRRALPVLLPLLGTREVRSAVRVALKAIGEPAKEALAAALEDRTLSAILRGNVPRAIAEIDPRWGVGVLLDALLAEEDGLVRFRILRAIGRLRRSDPKLPLDEAKLIAAGRRNMLSAFRYIDWRVTLEQGARERPERATPAHEVMCMLLHDKEVHALERTFRVMGLVHPHEDFERIFRGLKSKSAKARASSRELLENVLSSPARELTLALVEDAPDVERLAMALPHYTRDDVGYEGLLALMRERGGETLGALVAYHVGELGLDDVLRTEIEVPAASTRFVEDVVERARTLIAVPSVRRPVHG
jgi:AAA family ATP:ADP antiporter